MIGRHKHRDQFAGGRLDRLIRQLEHDPYHRGRKLRGPSACSGCGAVFDDGRWTWDSRPADAEQALCPACRRIRDRVPAGFLVLDGPFLTAHRAEIMNLIRNIESREKAEHPMKRIMDIEERDDHTVVTVTDPKLVVAVGKALHDAYEGELHYEYSEGEYLVRVSWRR